MSWQVIGYVGMFFAVTYRIPQIMKLCKTKKGGDISKTSFVLQNLAYISLLTYLLSKEEKDYILISYELVGLCQNSLILFLKRMYGKKAKRHLQEMSRIEEKEVISVEF
jgi:uncharacterized protein with PQ loop repeat